MALKIDGKSIQKKDAKKKRLEWASEFEKVASWGVLGAAALRYPARRCLDAASARAGARSGRRRGEGREGGTVNR